MKKLPLPKNIDEVFGENFTQNTKNLIQKYRGNGDLSVFEDFKFEKKIGDGRKFDKNYFERQILTLILSDDFSEKDKPLIQWLIQEFLKNIKAKFWVDLRSVMALLGFMLYKNMENEDLPTLYDTKFSACSDSRFSVDTEVAVGFGVAESLAYLENLPRPLTPKEKEIFTQLTEYQSLLENKEIKIRSYSEYISLIEKQRFAIRQEEIAEDCGLIEFDDE